MGLLWVSDGTFDEKYGGEKCFLGAGDDGNRTFDDPLRWGGDDDWGLS